MSPRPLYLHIGASKTGTSSLQRGIFNSAASLAEHGIGLPLERRQAHVRGMLKPLGWRPALGFARPPRPRRLGQLVPTFRDTGGERLLVSCEDLCEADPDRIRLLMDVVADAGLEPRVVLTVRGLASVVPSEWQQLIKRRLDVDYPTFLERVRDREGPWAAQFWQRQDVIATCQRWGQAVGIDHLDVVVTPSRAEDPDGLYRLFGDLLGFDVDSMTWPDRDINAAWGYTEAEVFRRVNAALGRRLPRHERAYLRAVRRPMINVLPRRASERIPFPPEHLDWLADVARSHVEWLHTNGVRVHGDPASLVPGPESAKPLPVVDEAEMSRVAVAALADLAVHGQRGGGSSEPDDEDDD